MTKTSDNETPRQDEHDDNQRRLTIGEALREAIAEEMRRDPAVFLIGEDIGVKGGFGGAFGVYLGLNEEFGPERMIDTPISEKAIAGAAVGAALMGMRPIADMQYADFLFECMDELVNQAAKLRYMSGGKLSVPMVMRAPVGTTNRGAQHGQCPESYFMHVPGLKVVCVSDAYHAKGILKSAVRDDNPVLIFEHKLLYGSKGRQQAGGLDLTAHVPREEYLVPLGKAVVKRNGKDVTIVATHLSLYRSLAAAEELANQSVDCEVIDPLSLLPLDTETLWQSVRKTGRLVIVHEDTLTGGWGAEIAARAADECHYYLESPIKRVAALDTPLPFAPILEQAVVPSIERIRSVILSLFEQSEGVYTVLQGVRMPALGQTTDELRIISWLKKEGDPVEQGEPLFEVETDKATLEVEAFSSGILRKIVRQEDEVVEVGTLVAYIGKAEDDLPGAQPGSDKVLASPPVRVLMREHGIDPRQVKGSGPAGRIERRDVEILIEQRSSSTGEQSAFTPVPHHRQVIAQRLTQSVQTIPQIALTSTIDMRQAQAVVDVERERGIVRLTYTHLILRAVARSLRNHPRLNTLWVASGPQFQQLAQANVGLAVAGDDTLLVVTILEPDRLSLAELVSMTDAAIARGRQGALIAADTAQAAMAVSNLGMYGVDSFTAIVDPAQTAILATGRVVEQPVVEEGSVRIVPQMKITLVIDHRVADGVAAALFLRTLSKLLESPLESPKEG